MAVRRADTPAAQLEPKPAPVEPDPVPVDEADTDANRVAELEAEVADLREQLARAKAAPTPAAQPRRYLLSQGVADDLRRLGKLTDPATGALLRRDPETGEVTATDRRSGNVTALPPLD